MGLVKSDAQRKANQLQRRSAIAAADKDIINGPKPTTWSSRMPAYAGTSLCPDPELRGGDTIGEDKDNQEDSEHIPCLTVFNGFYPVLYSLAACFLVI